MRTVIWDSDAYGVNTDSPETVSDWFEPTRKMCDESKKAFDSALNDLLVEIADMNGIPYDVYNEWDRYDWDEFREVLDI